MSPKWPRAVRKRNICLCLHQRMEILEKLEKGVSAQQLATHYNVSTTTIYKVRHRADEVSQYIAQNGCNERKVLRKPANEKVEARLHSWLLHRNDIGYRITDMLIREKASEFNKELNGPEDFNASKGWLARFKFRYNVKSLNIYEEGDDDGYQTIANNFVNELTEIMKYEDIDPANLYNMSETGLSWKFIPRKPLIHSVEKSELRKNWVTVALCANATGTHKFPPVFISKYASPRALKHCKDRLPVGFKYQRNAWMDRNLFISWYENDFKSSVRQHQIENGTHGRVLLIVNDCRVDDLLEELQQDEQFHIIFLPLNTMSIMDQGVVEKTKRSFRYKMLQTTLNFPGEVNQFYTDYDVKDCIDHFHEAWTSVRPRDIRNAWKKLLKGIPIINLTDNETDSSDEIDSESLRDIMKEVADKRMSQKEVEDWLSTLVKVENDVRDSIDKTSQDISFHSSENDSSINEEKMRRVFHQLSLWCKDQPQMVQCQVHRLKNYFDQK